MMNEGLSRTYRWLLRETNSLDFPNEKKLIRKVFEAYVEAIAEKDALNQQQWMDSALSLARVVLKDLGLGSTSIAALLLFRLSLESNIDQVRENVGATISGLLDDLNEINKISISKSKEQSEALINLILAKTSDIRAVLLYAVHLFNLKESAPQYLEALFYVYVPILHRLGFYSLKYKIEDAFLKADKPEAYSKIVSYLEKSKTQRSDYINNVIRLIKLELDRQPVKYLLKWRTKSIYSIYRKLINKNVPIEDVFDLFAIRIILNTTAANEIADCWRTYSIIANKFEPMPDRLRDWISYPKDSGYESLHLTVLGPEQKWIEVQIRSMRMDESAEKGLAAHWKYKGGKTESEFENYLSDLRKLLEKNVIDDSEKKLAGKQSIKDIYCFTPNGDLKKLPPNATVLDFAFSIHTNIGSRCVGALVNKKLVPIKYKLSNGDQVEVLTSKKQKPNEDWLSIVSSSRAKSRIRKYIQEQAAIHASSGKELLVRKLKSWKIEFNDDLVNLLIKKFKCRNAIELYAGLADHKYDLKKIKAFISDKKNDDKEVPLESVATEDIHKQNQQANILIIDENIDQVNYRLAKCCRPIRGDDITGFVTIGKGISIHRSSCPNLKYALSRYPYRKMLTRWNKTSLGDYFQTRLKIFGKDQAGVLNRLTEVITKELKIDIRSLNINTIDGEFNCELMIKIDSAKQLDMMIQKVLSLKGITQVKRI